MAIRKEVPSAWQNSRLRYLIAVLFLLGLAMAARLYYLQIIKADFYSSKADKQQRVDTQLLPRRGQIWVNNYSDNQRKNELSLLATYRNFASIYAVPKDLSPEQANFLAEKLYAVFGAGDMPDDYQAENTATTSSSTADDILKNRSLSYYLAHLQKANDPYEILIKKSGEI